MAVVVYGAASEIGEAVVEGFLEQGRDVVALDYQEIPQSLHDKGEANPNLSIIECDQVADASTDFVGLLDQCADAAGKSLRTLICVAPPIGQVKVLDFAAEELRQVVELELVVPALLMQEAGRRMVAQGGGQIVTFCSMSAKTGVHTLVAPFAAAKGGILAYMRTMAAELAPHGVTVNAIATSLFEPQVAVLPAEEQEKLTNGVPVRRFGKTTEAAAAAVYLASDAAGFITGETLNLSGGRFMD